MDLIVTGVVKSEEWARCSYNNLALFSEQLYQMLGVDEE